jgi:hypothetical protein
MTKSDQNNQGEGRTQNSPSSQLHTTNQTNTTCCANSLMMTDNARDLSEDEDPSSQSASEEGN